MVCVLHILLTNCDTQETNKHNSIYSFAKKSYAMCVFLMKNMRSKVVR